MTEFVEREIAEVKRIVLERIRGHQARVYFFGSRARGDARRWSDIDVAVEPLAPLPPDLLGEIRDALEDSSVIYEVSVFDLSHANAALRQAVERDGILWTA